MTGPQGSPSRPSAAGYLHPDYPASLAEFGEPRRLPRSGGWVLVREIPGAADCRDAVGCYPFMVCSDWSGLCADVEELASELVSLVVVTDPFGASELERLERCFDSVRRFKDHHVVDLWATHDDAPSKHHRRKARKALGRPRVEGAALTEFLVREHGPFLRRVGARSTYALSPAALETLCGLENVLLVGAGGAKIEEVYVFTWIERLKALGVPTLNLGGGVRENDAIAQSKQRWGGRRLPLKALRQVYRPELYAELCRRSGTAPDDDFFPPYHRPAALGTPVPRR